MKGLASPTLPLVATPPNEGVSRKDSSPERPTHDAPDSGRALKGAARRVLAAAAHFDTLLAATGRHEAIRHSISNLFEIVTREIGIAEPCRRKFLQQNAPSAD